MNSDSVDYSSPVYIGGGSSERAFTAGDDFYFISRRSAVSLCNTQSCRVGYTAALLSLLATGFYIWHGFWCMRRLGFAPAVDSGLHGRMLSLAEAGSFRRCLEDSSEWGSGVLPTSPLAVRSPVQQLHGSVLTIYSLQEDNFSEDTNRDSSPKQTVGVREQLAPLEQTVVKGLQHAKLRETVETGERHATVKQTVEGSGKHTAPKADPVPLPVISALHSTPDEAALRRLQEALQIRASEAKNLTKDDMKLLREARGKLEYMLESRSSLATALRKKMEKQRRLSTYVLNMKSTNEQSGGKLGRLRQFVDMVVSSQLKQRIDKTNSRISDIQKDLGFFRMKLNELLSQKQQRALSLRLAARRRQSGQAITAKEANALSIAKLVMNGFRKRNCLLSPTEGTEVLKMGFELSADVNNAVLVLSNLMEKVRSDSGCGGCPSCIQLKEYLPRCSALQKEAAMFALQLRSVTMTSAPEMLKGILMNIEGGALQLRRKLDVATQLLLSSPC